MENLDIFNERGQELFYQRFKKPLTSNEYLAQSVTSLLDGDKLSTDDFTPESQMQVEVFQRIKDEYIKISNAFN